MGHVTNEFSETSYQRVKNETKNSESATGKLTNAREVNPMPASHGKKSDFVKIVAAVGIAVLIASMIMWPVGTVKDIGSVVTMGKVFFGLSLTTLIICLIGVAVVKLSG